jgi:RNA polymerase sigma factor for flagellar operon FliA
MYTAQGTLDRQETIERYGAMVRRVAHQMIARLPPNVDVDDLIQAGMIGLFDAMSRYDAAGGAQFETFALQRVRGAMLDELRGADWMPRSVRKAQRDIEQAVRRLEQRLVRPPTESEIAEELGLDLAAYHRLLGDARGSQLLYLDDLGDRAGDDAYLDRNEVGDSSDPVEELHDQRFRESLVAAIENLPEREKYVMSMYYEQDMNLKEIGAVLGVTESRISQLHSQAVARIRASLKEWI